MAAITGLTMNPPVNAIRQQVRQQRRRVSKHDRQLMADAAARHLAGQSCFRNARRIAVYLPTDGEFDPLPVLERALGMGKTCFLPVLKPGREPRLWFARYQPGQPLMRNRYGILEPDRATVTRIAAWALDLVIAPLVGFDEQGHRIGMGGGYYDRTFAFKQQRRHWQRPRLIGLAYEFQKIARITPAPWDIAMNAVITPSAVYGMY